jgi:hypothetical protein
VTVQRIHTYLTYKGRMGGEHGEQSEVQHFEPTRNECIDATVRRPELLKPVMVGPQEV